MLVLNIDYSKCTDGWKSKYFCLCQMIAQTAVWAHPCSMYASTFILLHYFNTSETMEETVNDENDTSDVQRSSTGNILFSIAKIYVMNNECA